MNASEAREMLRMSQKHPELVTQIVPSPITFEWDETIADIIKAGTLGDLIYIEVRGQVCVVCAPGNHSFAVLIYSVIWHR